MVDFVGEVHGGDAGADGADAEFAGGSAHGSAVEGDPFFGEGLVVAGEGGGRGAVGLVGVAGELDCWVFGEHA